MMRRTGYGLLATVIGSLAITALCAASAAWSSHNAVAGKLLQWLDHFGLVKEKMVEAEIRPTRWLTFDDIWAIELLSYFGVYLAGCAILYAILAEMKGEDSLYIGTGFISGATTLVLFNYPVGIVLMILGAFALLTVRRTKRA
jgi:hypothetical protein